MDGAVLFYTETLGLALAHRYGDHWAQVAAGRLSIGLHPASPDAGPPGTRGAMSIGFNVTEPLEQVVSALSKRGATFAGPIKDDPQGGIRIVNLADPDGNPLYLCQQLRRG
jgi:catechol 2,3-dioxygenase-like lactoylglutathione lyase family enzyme